MPEIADLQAAWDVVPPQAASLLWLRLMLGSFLGVDTGYGPESEPVPLTQASVDWMQKQLESMSGGMSQEVFQALQEMEREVSHGK